MNIFKRLQAQHSQQSASKREQLSDLRVALLNSQYDLRQANFSVILVLAGNNLSACNQLLNTLHEWLDARYIGTHSYFEPSPEERSNPPLWRYWCDLPEQGKIGIFLEAWPDQLLRSQLLTPRSDQVFRQRLSHIARFEQQLSRNGTLVIKIWLQSGQTHLCQQQNPLIYSHQRETAYQIQRRYKRYHQLSAEYLQATHNSHCPWYVIKCKETTHYPVVAGQLLLEKIQQRLDHPLPGSAGKIPVPLAKPSDKPKSRPQQLPQVDLKQRAKPEKYRRQLNNFQSQISHLAQACQQQQLSNLLVFEGWDAAGKGGCIRRITQVLPAQLYRVSPIAAPTDEEQRHHYLWRFWRRLPQAGQLQIFDRSWYGRVLVERVEGFAQPHEWQRAYDEIRDFEQQLYESGIGLVKFFLHIDQAEQLSRFKQRAQTPYKKYKLTSEDYRNRNKWQEYSHAIEEMLAETSTDIAPWHLVSANDKRIARIEVLKRTCRYLEQQLAREKEAHRFNPRYMR